MGLFEKNRADKDGYKIRNSRLTGLSANDYMIEAEKIVQEYGGVIAEVMQETKTKYTAMTFPTSILPASKADLKEAFDIFLEPGSFDLPDEQRNYMSSIYIPLDRFVDDEDAKAKNEEVRAARTKNT